MLKRVFLTIDDSPSIYMDKKVSTLKERSIPAVFYVRGESVELHPQKVVNAIQQGFYVGNHSYSHPYFSEISLEECFEEINKTEALINHCYKQAAVNRPCKIIRFPYGDRGAGGYAAVARSQEAKEKVNALQDYLTEESFVQVKLHGQDEGFIDSFWSWDTEDYRSKFIANPHLYMENLVHFYDSYKEEEATVLLHDFDRNPQLFDLALEFLLEKEVDFMPFEITAHQVK